MDTHTRIRLLTALVLLATVGGSGTAGAFVLPPRDSDMVQVQGLALPSPGNGPLENLETHVGSGAYSAHWDEDLRCLNRRINVVIAHVTEDSAFLVVDSQGPLAALIWSEPVCTSNLGVGTLTRFPEIGYWGDVQFGLRSCLVVIGELGPQTAIDVGCDDGAWLHGGLRFECPSCLLQPPDYLPDLLPP